MLLQTDGMAQDHKWNVLCSSQTHNCFTSTDMDKNTFGSYYHIREPQTRNLQMSFKEYAQCAKHWTINKVLFKVWSRHNNAAAFKSAPTHSTDHGSLNRSTLLKSTYA